MTIFYFVFKRFFRKFSNVAMILILPIAAVFLPVGDFYPLPMGFQYYGLLLFFIAARLAGIILEDRSNRTLLRIGVAPITHFQYLSQNLLAYSMLLILLNGVVVILGKLYHGETLMAPLWLFIIYSFFSLTAIGFCLAWYTLCRNKEAAFTLLSSIIILMGMIGGVMWPVEIMPAVLQRVAMFLPTYWLAEGVLLAIMGKPARELLLPLGMMLLFSLSFLILGSKRRIV